MVVLHTYSVFVSSINTERRDNDLPRHKDCEVVGDRSRDNSSPEEQIREQVSGGNAMGEERKDGGTEHGSVQVNVGDGGKRKVSWRKRARVGVKATLKDLKLFLWYDAHLLD